MLCSTNKKYEYSFSLDPGKEYRISFYASPVFNNKMSFKILDTKTGKALLDLPGESEGSKKGTCTLREYWDVASEKSVYPFFDFEPEETLNLKLIIDIPLYKYKIKTAEADPDFGTEAQFEEITEKHNGCVTIFIQDKVLK